MWVCYIKINYSHKNVYIHPQIRANIIYLHQVVVVEVEQEEEEEESS